MIFIINKLIDFDGRIDYILLFQSALMQIHYNIAATSNKELLIPTGSYKFPFDLTESTNNYVSKIQRFVLPEKPTNDASVMFGDINNDGF